MAVDLASCSEFGGYGRSASQKDWKKQSDEGKQGDHGAVRPREPTPWVLRNESDNGDLHHRQELL